MFNLPPDDIWDPKTGSKSQGKRPISNAQGKRPVSGTSSGLVHVELRNSKFQDRKCTPGPASKPVYPEIPNPNAQDQRCVAGPSSRPASSQTVSSTSTSHVPVDSPMKLLFTGKEDDVFDPCDGKSDLAPTRRVRDITEFNLEHIWDREPAEYSKPTPAYHNDSAQFFAGGPDVPSETSRGSYEQNPHNAAPFVNGDSYPAMQMAPTSSAAYPSYPEESISFVAAIRMKKEQRRREEQELQEDRRLAWEKYWEEMKERKRIEDKMKSRYERPKTVEGRKDCIRKHMDMLSQRASHVCKDSHCFDETCTIGLPERQGCRYADSFHSRDTRPCVWGWGLMLRAYSMNSGEKAAMETNLDEIANWHRQRGKHGQKILSHTLVRDPPGAPVEGRNVFWVINPAELNGQSSGYPMRK
jgi:hypothetical protein